MSETLVQKVTRLDKKTKAKASIQTNSEFSNETKKIIIPAGMSKKEAAEDLMNQWQNEETVQDFVTMFEGWEWKDALRAVRIQLEEEFGWVKGYNTMWESPTEVSIVTNIKNGSVISETAYMGPTKFPAFEDAKGDIGVNRAGIAYVQIKAKKKYSILINEFFNNVKNRLLTDSIYRGKAVKVHNKTIQTMGGAVQVLDLEIFEIKENQSIFLNEDEQTVIDNFIIGQLKDKGKRTFLFPGNYGNGKTETAMNIGVRAIEKGMSFFYVKSANLFTTVLGFAKNYEPCVIFLEDIDEIASGDNRDSKINDILNTLDGVQTKGRDILTIFTTNHKDQISPPLRRPGRIDLIVEFNNPNKTTVEKICRHYFEKFNGSETLDYDIIVSKMPDASGAVVAEICKRASKLAARQNSISTDQIIAAITSMKSQVAFMKEPITHKNEVQRAFDTIREYHAGNREFND